MSSHSHLFGSFHHVVYLKGYGIGISQVATVGNQDTDGYRLSDINLSRRYGQVSGRKPGWGLMAP